MKKKKGQSTLEYVIIFSVVIIAILAFAWTTLQPKIKDLLDAGANKIGQAAGNFTP